MSIAGGTVGASIAVGQLSLGIWWETDPRTLSIYLPFCDFWIEGSETGQPWEWRWSLARLTVWKTEFRVGLHLNDWRVGLNCIELDDFSLHFGPFNVQIETGSGFDEDYPPGVPTLRLLFPRDHYIRPWLPRCRCCPPRDRRQCDDVTGLDGIVAQHRHGPGIAWINSTNR